jgi:hypothetical protein
VAYQFIVSDILPRHIYNTFLDNFVLLSFIIMNLTVVVNIAVHSLFHRGQTRNAAMVDKVSQLIFPVMFFASCFILAGAQGMVEDYLSSAAVVGFSVCVVLACTCFLRYLVYCYMLKHPRGGDAVGLERNSSETLDGSSGREEALNADWISNDDFDGVKKDCNYSAAHGESWSSFRDVNEARIRHRRPKAAMSV